MKSAEDVTKEIFLILQLPTSYDPRNGRSRFEFENVTRALSTYAEEQIQHIAHNAPEFWKEIHRLKELDRIKTRAEALEEAAKIAEATENRIDHFYSPHLVCKAVANQIRDLKDGKGKV